MEIRMRLEKQNAAEPDFEKLRVLTALMHSMLDNPDSSAVTVEELLMFQDSDGSFSLLDTYEVPSDIRVDFCHTPTYIGSAVLMREFLSGRNDLADRLVRALSACLYRKLEGHGYEAEEGRTTALEIFIKGGLPSFLETQPELSPEFHQMIHNILHEYRSALIRKKTLRGWGEDYREQWQNLADRLSLKKRFYVAYGSNMDKEQMSVRCSTPAVIGAAYLEDWQLTMPSYANIESRKGVRTPVVVWEIDAKDEKALDQYEGYPGMYDKTEVIITVAGRRISALAYVMTDQYKTRKDIRVRHGYEQQIISAYTASGFLADEFMPERR